MILNQCKIIVTLYEMQYCTLEIIFHEGNTGKRITVMSSFNKISTDQLRNRVGWGGVYLSPLTPFYN
jgi:hypothetical protein